jgi:hypothetical protein
VIEKVFPALKSDGYRLTSVSTSTYNCAAWAVGLDTIWLDHFRQYSWPNGITRNEKLESYIKVFEFYGFEECNDGAIEEEFEKIVIYAKNGNFKHVSRQLPSGKWTSKLGSAEDIEHETPNGLVSDFYGTVARFMKRALS